MSTRTPDVTYYSGLVMVVANVIHGAGLKINGKWIYSPFCRVFGILLHFASIVFVLTINVQGWSIAAMFPNVYVALMLFIIGSLAFRDGVYGIKTRRNDWWKKSRLKS